MIHQQEIQNDFDVFSDFEPTITGGVTFFNARQVFKFTYDPQEAVFLKELYAY